MVRALTRMICSDASSYGYASAPRQPANLRCIRIQGIEDAAMLPHAATALPRGLSKHLALGERIERSKRGHLPETQRALEVFDVHRWLAHKVGQDLPRRGICPDAHHLRAGLLELLDESIDELRARRRRDPARACEVADDRAGITVTERAEGSEVTGYIDEKAGAQLRMLRLHANAAVIARRRSDGAPGGTRTLSRALTTTDTELPVGA